MRLLHLLVATIGCWLLTGCVPVVAGVVGFDDEAPRVDRLEVPGKEVYFIGMMHVGRKEFYENVAARVREYQDSGFVFYVESISGYGDSTRLADSLALRKFRKVLNVKLTRYSQMDYPLFQRMVKRYNLVDQPRYDSLGVKTYRWVDHHYSDLVRIYEFKHGPIQLDSCDWTSPLRGDYTCTNVDRDRRALFMEDVVLYERNRLIAQTVRQSGDKKIVVIYGKAHLDGVKKELAAQGQ